VVNRDTAQTTTMYRLTAEGTYEEQLETPPTDQIV
jgi:hypothetical protein